MMQPTWSTGWHQQLWVQARNHCTQLLCAHSSYLHIMVKDSFNISKKLVSKHKISTNSKISMKWIQSSKKRLISARR